MSLIQLSTFSQQNLKITILAELAVKKKNQKRTLNVSHWLFLDLVVLRRTWWLWIEPLSCFEKNSKSTVIWLNTMVVVSFSASYFGIPCDWVESQGCRKVYQMQDLISSNFFFYLLHSMIVSGSFSSMLWKSYQKRSAK